MQKKQFMVFRLDDNVIITLLAVCILASLAFVVRFKNYKPCTDFTIKTVGSALRVGTIVRLETDVRDFKRLHWDFGDNQQSVTEVGSVMHSYDAPGDYTIMLIADGKCTEYKTITIIAAPEIVDSTLIAKVVMPATAEVDVPVLFTDTSSRATSWEWRFGETATVDGTLRNQYYTYKTPGWKTISVVINGNMKTPLVRKIFVNPKAAPELPRAAAGAPGPVIRPRVNEDPQTAPLPEQLNPNPRPQNPKPQVPEPVVMYPDVAAADFNQMLRNSAGGKRPISAFSKYFCEGNMNTTVILNGKATTFQQFFAKVAAVKKGDKLSLTTTLYKNKQNNCINKIDVIGKVKTGMLGMSWRDL